ncbi:alpha/beta fold hydrolase [Pseudonocardiaceae bacterium YIM PH 21723]|nr:alpha/beta fold hydrolase [Pseudonocardiaceae bacterium YIM PH 21723]
MPTEVSFDSRGTRCAAWHLPARSEALHTASGRPCVVMAHGFGATKDAGLLPFAEKFAEAGAEVLVFDYRGYGTSDGTPRQNVSHWRHRQDYHAAIAYARGLDGVDPDRIVLWGSSYSGGHVIPVAVQDGKVAGVVSQGAAVDGLAALVGILRYAGLRQLLRLTGHALLDLARGALGRSPHLIPVVGPPGSLAVITAGGSEEGYRHIIGPTFRNEMCARGVLGIPFNRPIAVAGDLTCPILVVIAAADNIAPPSAVREVAAKAGELAEVHSFDCGHFEIYYGEVFDKSSAAQVEFLRRLG